MNRRAMNFNTEEIEFLLYRVEKYKDIIENKKTDRITITEKAKAWSAIEREFNGKFIHNFRNMKILRTKYENIMRETKKYGAIQRTAIYKAGMKVNSATSVDNKKRYDDDQLDKTLVDIKYELDKEFCSDPTDISTDEHIERSVEGIKDVDVSNGNEIFMHHVENRSADEQIDKS